MVRATSPQGGAKGRHRRRHLCPPPWRTSGEKGGVALTTSTPLVRRAVTPGEAGTREAQPRFAFPQRTREIRVVPRLVQRFREVPHHNGEGFALSEKGVVRSRIATMLDRHPPVGKVAAHLTASA